jgi:hypothetical protein
VYWRRIAAAGGVLTMLTACTNDRGSDTPSSPAGTQSATGTPTATASASATLPIALPTPVTGEAARLVITNTSVRSSPGTPTPNTAYFATGGCLTSSGQGELKYVITSAADPNVVLSSGEIDCGTTSATTNTALSASAEPKRVQLAAAGLPDDLIAGYVVVVPQQ